MRHIGATVLATIAAAGLTACTGSSGSPHTTSSTPTSPAASSTHAAPARSPAEIWSSSLCSHLDPRKLAKVEGPGISAATARKKVGTEVGTPTFDFCTVALQRDGKGKPGPFDVSYGLSADTWTKAEWAAYKGARLKDTSGYDAEAIEIDGHSGLIDHTPQTGRTMVLVGDRVLTSGGPGTTHVRERLIA